MSRNEFRVVPRTDHAGAIPYDRALDVTRQALIEYADNPEYNPTRQTLYLPSGVRLPVHLGGSPRFGGVGLLTHLSVTPGRAHAPGVTVLHDSETGDLLAVLFGGLSAAEYPATTSTALRTSCISAVGADALARRDSRTLALLGSGKQARNHLVAFDAVREFADCRVYSPTAAHREAFVAEMDPVVDADLQAVDDTAGAVAGADVVLAATNATSPVIDGQLLEAGQTLVSIVGGNAKRLTAGLRSDRRREVDDETMARADRVFANSIEQARTFEQGDLYLPVERGLLEWAAVTPIRDVVAGNVEGRRSDEEIIVYKNNCGEGIVDVALATVVWEAIREDDPGIAVQTEPRAEEFERGRH